MSEFLATGIRAVKKAEDVILKYYRNNTGYRLKGDSSPITLADQEGQKMIIEEILKDFPDHSFICEEETEKTNPLGEYKWIIDPVDGTKNFMRGIPMWGTLLALMRGEEIILGITNTPEMNELVRAEKGEGCFLNDKKVNVSEINHLNEAFMVNGSIHYFENISKLNNLLKLTRLTMGHRGFGECWSYNLLASGRIDIMVEASIKIWDIAPATIITEEAGGKMTDLYGDKVGLKTTTALGTNGRLHPEILRIFNPKYED